MKVYKKIMDVIAEIEKIVMSLVLVFVTVITFVNVVVRKGVWRDEQEDHLQQGSARGPA